MSLETVVLVRCEEPGCPATRRLNQVVGNWTTTIERLGGLPRTRDWCPDHPRADDEPAT